MTCLPRALGSMGEAQVAALLAIVAGDYTDFALIMLMLIVNGLIGFHEEWKAQVRRPIEPGLLAYTRQNVRRWREDLSRGIMAVDVCRSIRCVLVGGGPCAVSSRLCRRD